MYAKFSRTFFKLHQICVVAPSPSVSAERSFSRMKFMKNQIDLARQLPQALNVNLPITCHMNMLLTLMQKRNKELWNFSMMFLMLFIDNP